MAIGRTANLVQSKIQMLLFGESFSGKSFLAAQLAYFHRPDGKPFRVLVLDAESGGMDDIMDSLAENGVDLRNIYLIYTQSLTEVRDFIKKAKNREDFYTYDEEGNETEEVVLDADGEPIRFDAIIVDGSSVLNLTTKQGLVELSKRRNKVKADRAGLIGDEKFVQIENAGLELKDYQQINFKGQDLVLDLSGCGLHYVVTAREAAEKQTVKIDGKDVTIDTGRKLPEGFKNMDYNVKTVIRMYRDQDDDYNVVKATVLKDRTKVHQPGETLVDPSLTDWQVVIDKTANRKSVVVQNTLSEAIQNEYETAKKEHGIPEEESKPVETAVDPAKEMIAKIKEIITGMSAPKKTAARKLIVENGFPADYRTVTELDKLTKILELVQTVK